MSNITYLSEMYKNVMDNSALVKMKFVTSAVETEIVDLSSSSV